MRKPIGSQLPMIKKVLNRFPNQFVLPWKIVEIMLPPRAATYSQV